MAVRAPLTVYNYRDLNSDGVPREEHWGIFEFLIVPRTGDRIQAYKDDAFTEVTVTHVTHYPLELPPAHPELATWHKEASLQVIARQGGPRE